MSKEQTTKPAVAPDKLQAASTSSSHRLSPAVTASVVSLWIPYTLLNTIFPGPILTYTLGSILAILAIGLLWWAKLTPRQLFLRIAPLSIQGAVLLLILSGFIPLALLVGRGQALNWLDDLVYAPASAIAQELYFRSALLAALNNLWSGHPRWVLVLQALLFAVWHIRAFQVVTIAPALGVLGLVFVGGLLWGKQVQRDQTVFYALLQHTVFLIVQ